MAKQFLRQITYMCLLLMLGVANWITAPYTSKAWIFILSVVAAIIYFFMAYICYRRARKIAEAIDAPTEINIRIVRLMPDSLLPAPKETNDDHEDIGSPI